MLNDYICQNRQLKDEIRKLECENKCLLRMVKNTPNNENNYKTRFSYSKYM